ncbi:MAG: YebC/PmpR family DNA-binding transcriptional regulator [Proteobacteria bacterium]|jgi:YebC/PmpR family DNA-binding regulatory protein|nr:YebC/PmpR family DNA-binding transcriptional regulator [Pseudomonadota bacterium]MDA0908564.1 YebC/PmpR family DNA-binding transcriptional regulator [Pseudomonadota bacterium]MDC1019845.1 YebC/PmpR family DNA-binding transcriptional regulator [Alphaproteobacteria bacterium]
MAGHSKFKNIMHRKGAQDAKRAKKFTRLIKELVVAAKSGTDPEANPRLRTALLACRSANMPKDNIERVLKKAEGGDSEQYDEIRYEGYGPGGVAVIVEALTDNRNRTASEVRATFGKFGGNLGETGSVNFMFDRVGQIIYPADAAGDEAMFEGALEAGADNVESDENGHEVTTAVEDFNAVREAMESKFGAPEEAGLTWKPQNTTPINEDQAQTFMKLMDALDDLDDVQSVSSNVDIPEDIMAKMNG